MRAILLGGLFASFISAAHAQSVEETVAAFLIGAREPTLGPGTASATMVLEQDHTSWSIDIAVDGCKINYKLAIKKGDSEPASSRSVSLDLSYANGEYIGSAIPWNYYKITIRGKDKLFCGDGICRGDADLILMPPWDTGTIPTAAGKDQFERAQKAFAYYQQTFCKPRAF